MSLLTPHIDGPKTLRWSQDTAMVLDTDGPRQYGPAHRTITEDYSAPSLSLSDSPTPQRRHFFEIGTELGCQTLKPTLSKRLVAWGQKTHSFDRVL